MSEIETVGPGLPAVEPRWLPGDPPPRRRVERIIRVDHAGEYGAVRIYQGQLAVLRRPRGRRSPAASAVAHMMEQERAHLARFDRLLVERRVRPTLLHPVWHAAGFALGAATALLGERAAMACTIAVEETIDRHYADQAAQLGTQEGALRDTVEQFRQEELDHRDRAVDHGGRAAAAYPVLYGAVRTASRLAIWLSQRI